MLAHVARPGVAGLPRPAPPSALTPPVTSSSSASASCGVAARHRRRQTASSPLPSISGSIGSTGGDAAAPLPTPADQAPSTAGSSDAGKPESLWKRFKDWVTGSKDREKIASMGMAVFFSYSAISNATYGVCLTIAWIAFVKQTGISPLASGQWERFLVFYFGLWTMQNIIRPLRFSLSIALAPLFDRLLNFIAARTWGDKKVAFGIGLLLMSVVMTTSLFSSIYFLGGLPQGLGPFPPLKRF